MTSLEQVFGVDRPVALVTGSGAPRVGNHLARALAERGYRLVIHANSSAEAARRTADELRQAGADALDVVADLTDDAAVERLLATTCEHYGRLDVLVNCAAIWERKPLADVTADDVRRHFAVNATAVFLCGLLAGRRMAAQPTGGVIVNIGDWAVVRPYRNYAAYFPSKGAVTAITRTLAVELAALNPRVRVNELRPGPVMLPDDLPAAERAAAIDATLVKREGSPAHVAQAALLLIENDFLTGVSLPVDGGRSVYAPSDDRG